MTAASQLVACCNPLCLCSELSSSSTDSMHPPSTSTFIQSIITKTITSIGHSPRHFVDETESYKHVPSWQALNKQQDLLTTLMSNSPQQILTRPWSLIWFNPHILFMCWTFTVSPHHSYICHQSLMNVWLILHEAFRELFFLDGNIKQHL